MFKSKYTNHPPLHIFLFFKKSVSALHKDSVIFFPPNYPGDNKCLSFYNYLSIIAEAFYQLAHTIGGLLAACPKKVLHMTIGKDLVLSDYWSIEFRGVQDSKHFPALLLGSFYLKITGVELETCTFKIHALPLRYGFSILLFSGVHSNLPLHGDATAFLISYPEHQMVKSNYIWLHVTISRLDPYGFSNTDYFPLMSF